MSTVYSRPRPIQCNENLNKVLKCYLQVLNSWQRDVDSIRMMHHEIWKESRVYPIIKQHRAGSRVEKQVRVLPSGKQTDVNYKFEIRNIQVNCDDEKFGIYWKASESSNVHGKLFITEAYKKELQGKVNYSELFPDEIFEFDESEGNFLVKPEGFKENVVRLSGFQYHKLSKTPQSVLSPSVPGKGAVNEYNVVPCLRLRRWPTIAERWSARGQTSEKFIFNRNWKKAIVETVPLFLVPTGNPFSNEREKEFRLCFSQVEVKCFEKITTRIRKYYGIGKYMFKTVLEAIDYLDSYHTKTILLWMAEEYSIEAWKDMSPTDFLLTFFDKIKETFHHERVEHFFVQDCNIFPIHKKDDKKVHDYQKLIGKIPEQIPDIMYELLRNDLGLPKGEIGEFVTKGMEILETKRRPEVKNAYISGYLTRLLSVITFSLYENKYQGTLSIALEKMKTVFRLYMQDKNINRIIPMVNATILRMSMQGISYLPSSVSGIKPHNADRVSELAHLAFEAYLYGEFDTTERLVLEVEASECEPDAFGVSVTSYHKDFKIDEQIHFIIESLEKESKDGKCPRFYFAPIFLVKHLRIQLERLNGNFSQLVNLLSDLSKMAESSSNQTPYLGKLSYKFSAVYLLHGYASYPVMGLHGDTSILVKYPLGSFNQRKNASNFNLR